MRCLIIRAPYAGQIVDGEKPVEFRKQHTRIRDRIGIIEAGTGFVIGECDLVASIDRTDNDYYYCVGWVCLRPLRYQKPKRYKHPKGAQKWVNVPIEPEQKYNPEFSIEDREKAENY